MELDKFVAETLIAISKGVEDAQNADHETEINPEVYTSIKDSVVSAHQTLVTNVDFDVALTVEDSASGGGKISVLGSGIGGSKDSKETLTSRVSFSVPITFK